MRPILTALLLTLTLIAPLRAQEAPGLYDRPILRLDPGAHTAAIIRMDVDAAGRWAVTGSHDRTVRVWSVESGALERTIPIPLGPGNLGRIAAVAISPDGETIAAGGWTRWTPQDPQEQIYLFDRATGAMRRRIGGLPSVVLHLAFSPDGDALLATLASRNGIRLFDPATGRELARDTDYGDYSLGAAFAPDGSFVTSALDGDLRLYARDGTRLSRIASGHARPFGVAIPTSGDRVAVGFDDSTDLRVFALSAEGLSQLFDADTGGVTNGDLGNVAWSRDGARLFAGGRYWDGNSRPALVWAEGGRGARRAIPAGRSTLKRLAPLPQGGLLIGAADPWLGRVDSAGAAVWSVAPPLADVRGQETTLSLSADGARVGFGYEFRGEDPAWFDMTTLQLTHGKAEGLAPPVQARLKVTDWANRTDPKLDGKPLALERYEPSRALAIHPDGARFVLGADWSLRAFSAAGEEIWR